MHHKNTIPYGYCHCGCGGKAPIAKKTSPRAGHKKGEPKRYIHNHHGRRPLAERFWEKVDTSGGPDACWPWTGARWGMGHGKFQAQKQLGTTHAHRVAWILTHGAIPKGLVIRHKCDVPYCQNPSHMELGTMADNTRDMLDRGRWVQGHVNRGESHARAKCTDDQIREIRRTYVRDSREFGSEALARKHGVKGTTILPIVNRKTWAHVED